MILKIITRISCSFASWHFGCLLFLSWDVRINCKLTAWGSAFYTSVICSAWWELTRFPNVVGSHYFLLHFSSSSDLSKKLLCHQSIELWQYGLWSFQMWGAKLERFLPKDQHTQWKLLNSENMINAPQKFSKIRLSKVHYCM